MGAIPPLTVGQWEEAFEAYKQYPEYQKINRGMSLEQFRGIFYWEYGHRLLGRIIGLVYLIPCAWPSGAEMEGSTLDCLCPRRAPGVHGLVHGEKRARR